VESRVDLPGPNVTYHRVHDGTTSAGLAVYSMPDEAGDDSLFPEALAAALNGQNGPTRKLLIDAWLSDPSGVKGLPNHEAFVAVAHPIHGSWARTAAPGSTPEWVWSDHAGLQKMLAEHFGCAEGRPADVEDTHYTQHGALMYPPGAAPDPLADIVMLHTNAGRDIQAVQMAGFGYLGTTGTATATGASSLTGSSETGVSHSSNDCAYQWIFAGPNSSGTGSTVYGLILSNTSGTTPVYTIDQWYNPASPGGAAGTTPNATAHYLVSSGGPPAMFVGLSTSTATPAAGDTTLASEITTVGGGLIRKITTNSHSAGAATWVATTVFTANGSDSLPVTIAKAGYSQSLLSGANNSYQTLVSPTATLSSSGDQLTTSWTFTMT